MNRIIVVIACLCLSFSVDAQKYIAEKSMVTFFSEAPIENITAENKKSLAIIDLASSQVAFSIPIADFKFEKQLMWEHFNEKYMESDKYPRATFQGKVFNFNPKKKGLQKVLAKGILNIHGVERKVEVPGTLEMTSNNKMVLKSSFMIKLEDYNITIPQLLWQNIAEQVETKLNFTLQPKS